MHRLVKQFETLYFLDGPFGGCGIFKDHKGLAFCSEVFLRDEIDDVAIFGEYFSERFFKLIDLDSLFEVLDLLTWVRELNSVGVKSQTDINSTAS